MPGCAVEAAARQARRAGAGVGGRGASEPRGGARPLRPSRCPGLARCSFSRQGFWGQTQLESGVPGEFLHF